MSQPKIYLALNPVVEAFKELETPYYLTGSIASSAHSIVRATVDVDIVADIRAVQVNRFVQLLDGKYYADGQMIKDAIRRKASFNLIHFDTMIKVDVFKLGEDPFQLESFKRRKEESLNLDEMVGRYYVATAEDVVLNKLLWYRKGGEVSNKQWHDVIGIIKVKGKILEMDYLRHWAMQLKVSDLLQKAMQSL